MNKAAVILLEELALKGFVSIESNDLICKFKLSKDTHKGKMIINIYNNRATAIIKDGKERNKITAIKYSRKECVNFFLNRLDLFLNPRLLKSFQGNGLSFLSYEHKNILIVNDVVHEVDLKDMIGLRKYITENFQYEIPLSLKEIIERLEKIDPESTITLKNSYNGMRHINLKFGSYRGNYEDLYIDTNFNEEVKVKDFLIELKEIIGKTVWGWKGGEYEVTEESKLYISSLGICSEMVITDIKSIGNSVWLVNEFLG